MGALSFLAPWFLGALAAVSVPILLHLRQREVAREVPFSATRFVPPAQVEQLRRRWPTDWLLLLLRCLAVALLAFAFARPFVLDRRDADAGPATVVAVDTSFSMAAPATWAEATRTALRVVDEAPAGSPVAVVAFDEGARVLSPLSADRASARRAIEGLRPGRGATSYAAPVHAAEDLLGGRTGTVVVVTDRQRVGLRGELRVPASLSVRLADVPSASANLAVAALVREANALVATIVNHGLGARTAEVTLSIDGRIAARQPASLDGGRSAAIRFDGMARDSGVAVARVTDDGGLAADDERTLLLDPAVGYRVWIVSTADGARPGGFYVERALQGTGRGPVIATRAVALPAEQFPELVGADRPDVIVLLATRGLGREARGQIASAVQGGTGLIVGVGPNVESGALAELLPGAAALRVEQGDAVPLPTVLAPVEARHPVFAAYQDRVSAFARVRFDRVVKATLVSGDHVLARFDNGLPAIVERPVGKGRVLLVASDLEARWNQWPLSPTFVPFVREAVAMLAPRVPDERDVTVGRAPAGIENTPGVHVLPDGRKVVVNVDPEESSLDLAEADEIKNAVTTEPATAPAVASAPERREHEQSLWRYAVAVALGVLLIEGIVGARRAAPLQ